MKKIIRIAGIAVVLLIIIIGALALFVKASLKEERLKAFILPKMEEFTGRRVGIDHLDVSLFKGIVVKGLSIKTADGKADFLKTDEFILDYSLLPLLRKEIVITKIVLRAPSVSLMRQRDGHLNYEDITSRKRAPAAPAGEARFPFSVATDRISVTDGNITFKDATGGLPDMALRFDASLSLASGGDLSSLALTGQAEIKELKVAQGGVQTTTTGKVDIRPERITIRARTSLGKETIETDASVEAYRTAPVVRCNLHAKGLDLERLLALSPGGGQRASSSGAAKGGRDATASTWSATGKLGVDTAHYKGYIIKDLLIPFDVKKGRVRIDPVTMKLVGGDPVSAAGDLKADMSLSLSGPSAAIKRSVDGKGDLNLSKLEVKRSAISQAVAAFTGVPELASPRFDQGRFTFTIRDEKVRIDGVLSSPQVTVNPSGTVDFDKRLDVVLDLKLSPQLSSRLPTGRLTGFLRDDKGWTVIPLRITGTAERPSVGPNQAAVGKRIEQEVEKRLLKGLFGK